MVAGDTIAAMIPLFCSYITRKDMDTVLGCLVTDSIGPGEYTDRFTKNAREIFHFEAGVAFRSPMLALMSAAGRLGINQGANIAVSALAPAYQRITLEMLGYTLSFYDHDPITLMPRLDEMNLRNSDALLLYEPFGILPLKSDLAALGKPIIEDISASPGASRGLDLPGTFGNFALCGLEQGGLVTSGGGCILFTCARKDASVVRSIAETVPGESVLTDYNAALGLAQLRDYAESLDSRKSLEFIFKGEVARTKHHTVSQPDEGECGKLVFPVILESGMRDVMIHAKKNGIETAPAFESSVVSMEDFPVDACPGAHNLAMRCVVFPLHEKISPQDARIISKVLATLP